jgi:hypothetical protein
MDRVGDILDRLGVPMGQARLNTDEFTILKPLEDSPDGEEYQDFLYNVVRGDLMNSVGLLDDISPSFDQMLDDPFGDGDMDVDYSDVLVLRGAIKIVIAIIALQQAYDLDFDSDETFNNSMETIETFLAGNTSFLSLASEQTQLGELETLIESALVDFETAVASIPMEPDSGAGQDNDFIRINDQFEAEQQIAIVRSAWDDRMFTDPMGGGPIYRIDVFLMGIDFRTPPPFDPPGLLPPFTGDTPGDFPDPTFKGVVVPPEF